MGMREELEEQIRLRENKLCVVCKKKIRFWQSTGGTAGHIDCIINAMEEQRARRLPNKYKLDAKEVDDE